MSETPQEHEVFIKTPKQLFVVVALAFIVPVAVILVLVTMVIKGGMPKEAVSENAEELVARRIKPVGEVSVVDANAPKVERAGQQIVETVCSACHTTGALNAPKTGDKAAWGKLVQRGQDNVTASAIKGVRQMPPRGGNPDLSDTEVGRAVAYMANQAGANWKEPAAAPAPAPTAVKTAASAPVAAPTPAAPTPAAPTPAAKGSEGTGKGKSVYDAACMACHATGAAGAPKAGDKTAWAPRIKTGMDALYGSSLKGKGAMPPKGGNAGLPDADVKAAVDYLVGMSR